MCLDRHQTNFEKLKTGINRVKWEKMTSFMPVFFLTIIHLSDELICLFVQDVYKTIKK